MSSDEVASAVRRLTARVELYRAAVSRYLGCSVAEARVMSLLRERGPLSVGEVAAALGARHSVVTGIADRLEARGFLERRRDRTDRRRSILALRDERVPELDAAGRLFAQAMVDLDDEGMTQVLEALQLAGEVLDRGSEAFDRRAGVGTT